MSNLRSWVMLAVVPVWGVGLACSDSGDATGNSMPPRITNSAGTASDGPDGAGSHPQRGIVTLLGANAVIPAGTWSFSGPPSGAGADEDTVSCRLEQAGSGSVLVVEASRSSARVPAASFELQVDNVAAFEKELSHTGLDTPLLDVLVALPSDDAAYVYGFGADTVSVPAVYSSCTATVSKLSQRWATGQLACRNLVATSLSADAPAAGAVPPRASATIAFDCPVVVTSAPEPGGAGGSSGGTGGTFSSGGIDSSGGGAGAAASGSAAGGFAGSGGSGTPKSCHGVVASCLTRSSATCSLVKGCSTSGECGGVSSSCYGRSMYSCSSQEGCYWSGVSKLCSGSAWSCSLFSGSYGCNLQEGCNWRTTCDGVATSCILLSEYECTSQPGCTWD